MKNIEAVEQLKLIRDNVEQPIPEYTRTGLSITALTHGIEALEKQIPRAVIKGVNLMTKESSYYCPRCQKEVGESYCECCGQRIYWGI